MFLNHSVIFITHFWIFKAKNLYNQIKVTDFSHPAECFQKNNPTLVTIYLKITILLKNLNVSTRETSLIFIDDNLIGLHNNKNRLIWDPVIHRPLTKNTVVIALCLHPFPSDFFQCSSNRQRGQPYFYCKTPIIRH